MQPVAREALFELEGMLDRATTIPLTDQVRFDRDKALTLVEAASAEASIPTGSALAELQALMVNAPPVPLTRQHRVPLAEAKRLIAEAQAGL